MNKFSKFSKMVNAFKQASADKVSDFVFTSIHSLINGPEPERPPKPETASQPEPPAPPKPLTPVQRAIQAFLTSSKLEGYVDPFMDLEAIKKMPYSHTTAHRINQAMCIIRYLCKGDPLFCEASLEEILKALDNSHAQDFSAQDYLKIGADAARSESFQALFEDNPNDAWAHLHIMSIPDDASFDHFIGLIQALFNTTQTPYPNEINQIEHDDYPNITNWIQQCNQIIAPDDLVLVELKCNRETQDFALLKQVEFTVLNGMLKEIRCEDWASICTAP